MQGKWIGALAMSGLVALAGCEKKSARFSQYMPVDSATVGRSQLSLKLAPVYAASQMRFVAVSHKLDVVASESELPKAWQSVIDFCATIQCEVVSSSISSKTRIAPPSGAIALRVVPGDINKLFAYLAKQGNIVQHSTESVDKTSDVVDTEAKIKNLTTFRDNLRTMLAKPSATVKDSVEIQQQLTEVQSQLDSETAQRKILANETEKVAVEVSFRVDVVEGRRRNAWSQIANAFRESGDVLAESVYWMILTIVTALPWTILAVPLVWLAVKLWRKLRGNRPSFQSSTSA
jgi:hypothetical protein